MEDHIRIYEKNIMHENLMWENKFFIKCIDFKYHSLYIFENIYKKKNFDLNYMYIFYYRIIKII